MRTIQAYANTTRYFIYVLNIHHIEFPSLISGVPSAPKDLQVKETTEQSISVTWSPPDDDGGKPVTSYIIEWNLEGDKM